MATGTVKDFVKLSNVIIRIDLGKANPIMANALFAFHC